ncbi:MAG: type II toxin-antitoxin system RelB/DinJ family antitoxin [Oscillospiraceae bacterium]
MAKTSNLNIRIDPILKEQIEALYANFGMNITEAVNIFLHQSLIYGGLPFSIKIDVPNKTTLEAMQEADIITNSKKRRFDTAEEMFSDLGI